MRQATLSKTHSTEAEAPKTRSHMYDETPLDLAEERRLLADLAAGDRQAAEVLARRSYRPVFASLLKLGGDPELAAELTQETFRRAWSALDSFDGRARFSTWLYRIAFNLFVSHRRRPQRLASLDDQIGEHFEGAEAPGRTAHRQLEARQAAERLRRAVGNLPESLQLVVTARFWGDIPIAEIARLEGLSAPAIRKRLRRAEKLLRGVLSEEDR